MSVPEQVPYKEYRATGSNNSFEITFYLPDPKDLVVMVNKEIPLVGAYSIQGNTVVFSTPPNEGDLVELTRDTQLDRETNFKSYDNSFRPETINFDLDKIWLVLQESNLVDAKILARLKQEIEWRRTHDFNYDELAQVREKQLFDALKGYTDTLNAATNPGIFQGVIAGVVFAQDGKSIQTHLEEILDTLAQERENIDSKADQIYVEEQLDLKADQQATYNKTEVDAALGQKADQATTYTKSEVDSVVAPLTGGHKGYTTLALAQAAQGTLPVNSIVEVTNDPTDSNNGTYQWNGTILSKSPYDPLTQAKLDATTKANAAEVNAKSYTDQKTAFQMKGIVGKNLFDKSKAINGKGLGDTGAEITASTRSVSDFIAVLPNTAYSFTATTKVCFYDSSKNFVQLSAGALANVITVPNAAFMRLDVATASLDQAQAEFGPVKTVHEPYSIFLKDNMVSEKNLKQNSVSSSKIKSMSIGARHFDDATFLNMHNAETLRKGISLSLTDGYTETALANFDVTDFIPCKPNTTYTANEMSRVLFYADDGTFISASADKTFTTPANCYQLRFNLNAPVSYRFQLNIGTTVPAVVPQPYKFMLSKLNIPDKTKAQLTGVLSRKYSLTDAWFAWQNGEKFPICFLGDSTTNGNGTTGFVPRVTPYDFTLDYVSPNSYPTVLQALLREATGNSVMRVYNAGFGGQSARWAAPLMDEIMGHAYADTKMLGISHGINDRTANLALYASNFYRDIETIINWCLNKGIQPFLLTTQPTIIPKQTGSASGPEIDEVANNIKRELSQKWGLEIIDVNKFGQQFMQYSSKPLLNDIMEYGSNAIHFGDGGHKFTAELMFANFCKRTIWTEDGEQLDYTAQQLKSDIVFTDVKQIVPFKQGFKVELNTTQATAENKLLQDFWVFNAGRKQLSLTAYYANAATGQYVEVDGVQTTIASQGQALGSLDLGLHKIKAYSGATTQLDWLGFKLI